MAFKHSYLSALILTLIGVLLCPTAGWPADEYRVRLSMQVNYYTRQPSEVQPPPAQRATILRKKRVQNKVPRQRNPQLTSQHLLIIGYDEKDREIARVIIPDPRLIRTEETDASGRFISKHITYEDSAEFSLLFPENPQLHKLKFFHPNWTGEKYILELIGETSITGNDTSESR